MIRCGVIFYYDSNTIDFRVVAPIQVSQVRSVDDTEPGPIDYSKRTREQEQGLEHIRTFGADLHYWPVLPAGHMHGLNVVEYDWDDKDNFEDVETRPLTETEQAALLSGQL